MPLNENDLSGNRIQDSPSDQSTRNLQNTNSLSILSRLGLNFGISSANEPQAPSTQEYDIVFQPDDYSFSSPEPLEYLSFIYLMEKSTIVLTDSGGIQEEAPGLGKPVLVMRNTTERPEALEAGTVKLVGTDYHKILNEVSALLDEPEYYDRMSKAVNPYGDGEACKRIINTIQYV